MENFLAAKEFCCGIRSAIFRSPDALIDDEIQVLSEVFSARDARATLTSLSNHSYLRETSDIRNVVIKLPSTYHHDWMRVVLCRLPLIRQGHWLQFREGYDVASRACNVVVKMRWR